MGIGRKRTILLRGVTRSLRRVNGLGTSFRVVVTRDGNAVVEAETVAPVTEAQRARLSAKLLDALTVEMKDVVEEVLSGEARARLTLRVLQPGSLARPSGGRGPRPAAPRRIKVD
jgi:hypothetical protein